MTALESNVFFQLAVSLALGLLVGLQRERAEPAIAGIRTFPLITILGTVCGWLAQSHGGWIIGAGLLALAALLFMANFARIKSGDIDPGLTTETAALVLFGLGACIVVGSLPVAVTLGGVVAVLLQLKRPLHEFVAAIGETDMKAIMQFVLLTLVILPILPNEAFGPYGVLNPFKLWLFVVLIVSLSLAGYVIFKFVDNKVGVWLGGLLGGIISSTATTITYARRSQEAPGSAGAAALVIMIASTVVFARVLVLIGAVAPGSFSKIAPPLIAMLVACVLITAVAALLNKKSSLQIQQPRNPAQLKTALIFGALYAIIRLGTAAAQDRFGASGLYVVAGISGLTDMDAITLSTSQLAAGENSATGMAWRAILIASMANIVFKAGLVAALGNWKLLRWVLILFGAMLLAGGAILWLWPA